MFVLKKCTTESTKGRTQQKAIPLPPKMAVFEFTIISAKSFLWRHHFGTLFPRLNYQEGEREIQSWERHSSEAPECPWGSSPKGRNTKQATVLWKTYLLEFIFVHIFALGNLCFEDILTILSVLLVSLLGPVVQSRIKLI